MRFNHQDSPDSGRNPIGFRTSRSENEARMNLKKGTLYFITGKFITKSCQENCGLAIFWISYFNHHLCKLCCISSRRNLSKIEFASSSRFWSSARFWSSGRFWSSISKFDFEVRAESEFEVRKKSNWLYCQKSNRTLMIWFITELTLDLYQPRGII